MSQIRNILFFLISITLFSPILSLAQKNTKTTAKQVVTKPTQKVTGQGTVLDFAKGTSKVEFFAVGKPSMLKINGTGAKLAGSASINGNLLNAKLGVAVKSFVTGIELRDDHMKEKYLEVGKYPNAILQITNVDLGKNILTEATEIKGLSIKGLLTLHGVTKEVTIDLDVVSSGSSISVDATTKFLITDYAIELPTYLGIKLADEVTIKASAKLTK